MNISIMLITFNPSCRLRVLSVDFPVFFFIIWPIWYISPVFWYKKKSKKKKISHQFLPTITVIFRQVPWVLRSYQSSVEINCLSESMKTSYYSSGSYLFSLEFFFMTSDISTCSLPKTTKNSGKSPEWFFYDIERKFT